MVADQMRRGPRFRLIQAHRFVEHSQVEVYSVGHCLSILLQKINGRDRNGFDPGTGMLNRRGIRR